MSINPTSFERATGVVEVMRVCNAKDCGRSYRGVSHEMAKECIYCGSSNTSPLRMKRISDEDTQAATG